MRVYMKNFKSESDGVDNRVQKKKYHVRIIMQSWWKWGSFTIFIIIVSVDGIWNLNLEYGTCMENKKRSIVLLLLLLLLFSFMKKPNQNVLRKKKKKVIYKHNKIKTEEEE